VVVSRADRIAGRLAEHELDALLVAEPANLRYLTGFTGSNGFAVVGPQVRRFVTDFRYVEQAKEQVPDFDRELGPQDLFGALAGGWPEGGARLGFDDAHVTVRAHRRLRAQLPAGVELVPAAGIVEDARAVKEPEEVARIAAAASLVDEIYGWLLETGIVGRTERDVAVALEHEMRLRGASGPSFPSIVASAEHGALPHASPRDVPIARDTLVTIDIGAVLDGYCSDCTRTWATGDLPGVLAETYALVLRAQVAALDAVRPGPEGREIDAVARDLIAAAGHGEHFGHGLGHGVGLVTHEAPRLARTAEDRLVPGHVVTVEPGVYLPGVGGVRIEDLVVVTESGRDVLSSSTKELLVVG
jgi:Xaa-Pro aminopeptidase